MAGFQSIYPVVDVALRRLTPQIGCIEISNELLIALKIIKSRIFGINQA